MVIIMFLSDNNGSVNPCSYDHGRIAASKALRTFEAEAGVITDDETVEVRRLWPRG